MHVKFFFVELLELQDRFVRTLTLVFYFRLKISCARQKQLVQVLPKKLPFKNKELLRQRSCLVFLRSVPIPVTFL